MRKLSQVRVPTCAGAWFARGRRPPVMVLIACRVLRSGGQAARVYGCVRFLVCCVCLSWVRG